MLLQEVAMPGAMVGVVRVVEARLVGGGYVYFVENVSILATLIAAVHAHLVGGAVRQIV